jgi:hypothetical protein
LATGRKIRVQTVVDTFSRFSPVLDPRFSYRGEDVVQTLETTCAVVGYGLSEDEVRDRHPSVYQHLSNAVRPQRDGLASKSKTNDAKQYAAKWWLFGKPRPELRKALSGVSRYIATIETAKHRVFQFLPMSILPDNKLTCIALDDAYALGVLSSRLHVPWAIASGSRLGMGDDPVYVKSRCFDPFPFPADVPEPLKDKIRTEAEALDALRKRVLESHEDLRASGCNRAATFGFVRGWLAQGR